MAKKKNKGFTESCSPKGTMNFGIVGCGKNSEKFLEILRDESFPCTNFNIAAICDKDPDARACEIARTMGATTTDDCRDLLKMDNVDVVVDMRGDRELMSEMVRNTPEKMGIMDKNAAMRLMNFISLNAEKILSDQKAFFEKVSSALLFRQTNASILILNKDFTIYDANDVFLEGFGKTKQEVVGLPCYIVTRGMDTPCPVENSDFRCPMVETLQTGESAFVIQEIPISRDNVMYCNVATYPMKDPDGNVVRIIELRRNVTNEISTRWEKRIRDLKADMRMTIQEDRMISLGKLVASCVHEINNPIQGMLTFSHLMIDMLKAGLTDQENLKKFNDFLSMMSNELERCGSIVSGLLSFSRESPMEYKDVVVNDVFNSVLMLTRHKIELQNIRLFEEIPKTPLIVRGDTNQLQQCFLNLVFNAIEAMPGGGELYVDLKRVPRKKQAKLEVRDTGYGISDTNLDHIFDPFFTTKKEGEGTGLGLSIVYGVVKNHGGTIRVESKPKQGATFTVHLPIE